MNASVLEVRRIPVAQIRESIVTLRTVYDKDELQSLADSLKGEKGQLQAITVQASDDGEAFELIIGSRRLRAAKLNGHTDILAHVIKKCSQDDMLFMALEENFHRQDLNPFEEAQGFLRLMKEHGHDQKTIAAKVHKNESYVRSRLELLSMPEDVKVMVASKALSIQHMPALRGMSDAEKIREAKRAVKSRLTASELKTRIARKTNKPSSSVRITSDLTVEKASIHLVEMKEWLQKVSRRMPLRRLSAREKSTILAGLQELEYEIRTLRANLQGTRVESRESSSLYETHQGNSAPTNHGQEWTTHEINRITEPRRPSDEELTKELGRSVIAIRAMRAKNSNRKEKVR